MKPWPHQVEISQQAIGIIKEHMMVYLAMEERTGKSLTALLTAEGLAVNSVLVLTKKKALEDWKKLLVAFKGTKLYEATNYHNAWKVTKSYDLVILDECHNYLSAFPKIGTTATQKQQNRRKGLIDKNIYEAAKRLCKGKPIIYVSATPHAQGHQQLYHQFSLSSWSPWSKYSSFYEWFKQYGKPYTIKLNGREVNQYDKCRSDLIVGTCEHLFISRTRRELGFEQEPEDQIHYISLSSDTTDMYNTLVRDGISYGIAEDPLVCDTTAKLRAALHMLEGGTAKIDEQYIVLDNDEKLAYIHDHFGDTSDLVIMYNYKAEKIKLERSFKYANILQATSFAEGVDLSRHKHLVVYSQDWSTARHTQRRARQCNLNRVDPIVVHFLLVKKAISEQVYKTVAVNKVNFVDSVFERSTI